MHFIYFIHYILTLHRYILFNQTAAFVLVPFCFVKTQNTSYTMKCILLAIYIFYSLYSHPSSIHFIQPDGCLRFNTFLFRNDTKYIIHNEAHFVGYLHIMKLRLHYYSLLCLSLRGLSPRANYTDRAAAAGRRS